MTMKIKSSLLAGALSVLAIVFSSHSQAIAQYDGKAVTITFKRPPTPPGFPDLFRELWFEHTFPVGEYEVDVSSPHPGSLRFAQDGYHHSVFSSGKGATAVVGIGYTAEICGEMVVANKWFCLPLAKGRLNYLDVFATVKVVKAQKNRASNPYSATIWASDDFTGEARDLGIGTHDISNLDFRIYSVWVPTGFWVRFCMDLSADRKRCGAGRGTLPIFRDSQHVQLSTEHHVDTPQYKYNYVLVGKGQPPSEPKPSILITNPNSDIKKIPGSSPKPKQFPKSKKLP